MTARTPQPLRALVWLLRLASSRDAANATVGDALEELAERRAIGRAPRSPVLWINGQILSTVGMEMAAAGPRALRSTMLILRDAFRATRAAPAYSLFVIIVLAIGATLGTVTFSIVDAVLLKPLPLERPEQLVTIATRDRDFKPRITPDVFWRLRDELHSVEALSPRMTMIGSAVTIDGRTDEWPVTSAGADIFRILRLSPAIGRFWTTEDELRGDTAVAVLGYRFWRDQLGSDPSILGKTVSSGKRSYAVIGVLSAASDHPSMGLASSPIYVPMVIPRTPSAAVFGIIARMRPGVTPAQVADDVKRLSGATDWQPVVSPLLHSYVAAPVRRWMQLALAAAALVVLVTCANAATLMLARTAGRAQEMAVRASLGASRRQIAMTVLAEGLMLSVASTVAALLLSAAAARGARAVLTATLPGLFRASTIAINGRVLAVAIACGVVTGVLFSLVPAWQVSRAPVSALLKDSDAPTATGRRRWRSVFLTAEIAAVVVLLVVSWLFVASLVHALGVDLGIDRTNLLAVNPRLEFQTTVDDVRQRIERVPGVSAVAVSTGASLPLVGRAFGGAWITATLQRADGPAGAEPASSIEVLQYRVTPNYFEVSGLRFLRGGAWDDVGRSPVVVLDVMAARRLFGDEDPLGRQVRIAKPAGVFTVVGTVPHVYALGPEDEHRPSAYFPLPDSPTRSFAGLFVKTSRPADEVLHAVTGALKAVAPAQKDPFVFVADDAVRRIIAPRRFNAGLMSLFGLVGTLIGAAGVFAVMMSFVVQQTKEIGVRVALGASPSQIQRGVLALASRHLLVGLALGVPCGWWLSRGFATLLFQVTPADASVYLGVSALLIAVGLLAAWIPARRAARIDPIISLRR